MHPRISPNYVPLPQDCLSPSQSLLDASIRPSRRDIPGIVNIAIEKQCGDSSDVASRTWPRPQGAIGDKQQWPWP